MSVKTRTAWEVQRIIEHNHAPNMNGCWVWLGSCTPYPSLGWGVIKGAHRVSYAAFVGPIGDKYVLHKCDNPACVNPEHLWLGSQRENIRDCLEKGRYHVNSVVGRIGCRGSANPLSKLTEAEVLVIKHSTDKGANLARRFRISQQTICDIRKGRKWAHL